MTNAMEFHRFHQTLDSLTAEYQLWLTNEGLPQLSADELLWEDLTPKQRKYVRNFLQSWEAIETEGRFRLVTQTKEQRAAEAAWFFSK